MIKKNLLIFFLLWMPFTKCFAQPANDICTGAPTVTPDGTCVAGTTAAAGDHWVGSVGCQSGNNHAEVWYTFVATGSEASMTVTNGTQGGNIEIVLVESTGACGGLTLEGTLCGASPLSGIVSNTLVVGATYYYTISSNGANGTFTSCVTTITPPPSPGQDCPVSDIWCSAANFSVGNVAAGAGAISGNASVENLSALGCLATDERRPQWYRFTVGSTGNIEFLIDPITNTDDYDWAIYDITTSGCSLTPGGGAAGGATQIACNYWGCPGNTGIIDAGTACATTNFLNCVNPAGACNAGDIAQFSTAVVNLTAGRTYAFVIDNFTASVNGFNFTWGSGSVIIGPQAAFSITNACDTDNIVDVSATYPNAEAGWTFSWNWGDGSAASLGTTSSHTYATSGTYNVALTVTDPLGCVVSTSLPTDCTLPIELLDFTGEKSGEDVELAWQTASETNNDYFTLERSLDGINYQIIGEVDAAGNSSVIRNYEFIDASPFVGRNYYRLKQTDYDGRYVRYDPIIVNNHSDDIIFDVYPNPANELVKIDYISDFLDPVYIKLTDMNGKIIYRTALQPSSLKEINWQINTSEFGKGMYLLYLTQKDKTSYKLLVIE